MLVNYFTGMFFNNHYNTYLNEVNTLSCREISKVVVHMA